VNAKEFIIYFFMQLHFLIL